MTPSLSTLAAVEEQAARVAVIDPTALALLSIFGGAALTVIAGFIGAWLQTRREHDRWVREKRLTAYLSFLTVAYELDEVLVESDEVSAEVADLSKEFAALKVEAAGAKNVAKRTALAERQSELDERLSDLMEESAAHLNRLDALFDTSVARTFAVSLLGPSSVSEAATQGVIRDPDRSKRLATISAIEAEMRAALMIRG